jgi:hypothetical protein
MFAMAATWQPLHKPRTRPTPREMPPVILVDFHDGMLAFAIEGDAAALTSPRRRYRSPPMRHQLSYPLTVSLAPIAPHATSR